MKNEAKQRALSDLMKLLMPSRLNSLKKKDFSSLNNGKKDAKEEIKKDKVLKTQKMIEESTPEEIEKPTSISFSQILASQKSKPDSSYVPLHMRAKKKKAKKDKK